MAALKCKNYQYADINYWYFIIFWNILYPCEPGLALSVFSLSICWALMGLARYCWIWWMFLRVSHLYPTHLSFQSSWPSSAFSFCSTPSDRCWLFLLFPLICLARFRGHVSLSSFDCFDSFSLVCKVEGNALCLICFELLLRTELFFFLGFTYVSFAFDQVIGVNLK